MEAVRIRQGDAMGFPVRICRLDRFGAYTLARLSDRLVAA
jgi:hypothetical protein